MNSVLVISYGRLDEDGKVLSPEEILYRVSADRYFITYDHCLNDYMFFFIAMQAVQSINMSHDAANSQMDIKVEQFCFEMLF